MNRRLSWGGVGLAAIVTTAAAGCHDGPLYAIKKVNPYFVMKEWKEDRELGVTDDQRRQELVKLTSSIAAQSAERQRYWMGELTKIMENDPSAEMRFLAVAAAGKAADQTALALIERGLDDDDLKVRMEACRALGRRGDDAAARMLAAVVGTETDDDVRKSAIAALGNFQNRTAVDSLRGQLKNSDPAMQRLVISSLRDATGKDYGDQPREWIAALNEPATDPGSGRF